jgi:hypothetical protein
MFSILERQDGNWRWHGGWLKLMGAHLAEKYANKDIVFGPPAAPDESPVEAEIRIQERNLTLGLAYAMMLATGRGVRALGSGCFSAGFVATLRREYNRIADAEHPDAEQRRQAKTQSMDAPAAPDGEGNVLKLGDTVEAPNSDPLEILIAEEKENEWMRYLTPREKAAFEDIVTGRPVRGEADAKARTRLRKKLRQLGA